MAFASTATVQNYSIAGYTSVNGLNANLLPIALSNTNYTQMLAGQTSDQYTYQGPTSGGNSNGTVTNGPDGIYELHLPREHRERGELGSVNSHQ